MNTKIIDRRTFLGHTGTASLILGFPFIIKGGQENKTPDDQSKETPRILKEGLARMKEEFKYGLVIVIPEGEKAQADLTNTLQKIIQSTDEQIHESLSAAVWMCLPEKDVQDHINGYKKEEKLISLDMSGMRVDGVKNMPEDFEFLLTRLQLLLYGKKNATLEKWAEEVKGKFKKDDSELLEKSISGLKDEKEPDFAKDSEMILSKMPKAVSLVVLARKQTESKDLQKRFTQIIEKYFSSNSTEKSGTRLPFGLIWEQKMVEGADDVPFGCPACGMVVTKQIPKKFLKLVTK